MFLARMPDPFQETNLEHSLLAAKDCHQPCPRPQSESHLEGERMAGPEDLGTQLEAVPAKTVTCSNPSGNFVPTALTREEGNHLVPTRPQSHLQRAETFRGLSTVSFLRCMDYSFVTDRNDPAPLRAIYIDFLTGKAPPCGETSALKKGFSDD